MWSVLMDRPILIRHVVSKGEAKGYASSALVNFPFCTVITETLRNVMHALFVFLVRNYLLSFRRTYFMISSAMLTFVTIWSPLQPG